MAGDLAADMKQDAESFPQLGTVDDDDELVEKETRARFKRMCEGYFESVSRKLVIEHKVCSSQLYIFLSIQNRLALLIAPARTRSQKP